MGRNKKSVEYKINSYQISLLHARSINYSIQGFVSVIVSFRFSTYKKTFIQWDISSLHSCGFFYIDLLASIYRTIFKRCERKSLKLAWCEQKTWNFLSCTRVLIGAFSHIPLPNRIRSPVLWIYYFVFLYLVPF